MEAYAAGAAADVQHAAADEAHRTTLINVIPLLEWRQEVSRIEGHHEAIVALDNLLRGLTGERVVKNGSPDITNARLQTRVLSVRSIHRRIEKRRRVRKVRTSTWPRHWRARVLHRCDPVRRQVALLNAISTSSTQPVRAQATATSSASQAASSIDQA
jgi:hypothetical protein